MKKVLIIFLAILFFAPCANAYNASMEALRYKEELSRLQAEQEIINKQQIQYYQGKPDILGVEPQKTSSGVIKKYEKKGVKFKLTEEEKKETAKKQQKEAKPDTSKDKDKKEKSENKKTDTQKPQENDNHNADAE